MGLRSDGVDSIQLGFSIGWGHAMKRRYICRVLCSAVLAALTSGCGPPEKAPVSQEKQTVELGELPELGALIGPLDDGRVKVAPPKGWRVPSRKAGLVIYFKESERLTYPRIHVTAADCENIINVSKDNVQEFARQVAAELNATADEQQRKVSKLTEPVRPVEVGRFFGVTHARRGKDKNQRVVQRVFVETVLDGRRYTVELQALKGTLRKYRPHLHAVAGGIEPVRTEAAEDPDAEDGSGILDGGAGDRPVLQQPRDTATE